MPACSTGFCVASTRNGTPASRETPSIVTRPSSITSSSADCVLGLARLISSASTMLAKMGPAWNSKTPSFWSYTLSPVMSLGSRSGVNWMRVFVPCTDCPIARARDVLPVPGTSSSSTWPSLSIAVSTSSTTWRLPSTARSTLSAICPNVCANQSACSCVIVMSCLVLCGGGSRGRCRGGCREERWRSGRRAGLGLPLFGWQSALKVVLTGASPQPWASQFTETAMPSTRTAPIGTVHVPGSEVSSLSWSS